MDFDQFVDNFSKALAFECKRTEGLGLTQQLEYKVGLVVMDGKITGYTLGKSFDSLDVTEETE